MILIRMRKEEVKKGKLYVHLKNQKLLQINVKKI